MGRLPNATQTSNGLTNMALCMQRIHFVNDTMPAEGVHKIKPDTPLTSKRSEKDPNVYVLDS